MEHLNDDTPATGGVPVPAATSDEVQHVEAERVDSGPVGMGGSVNGNQGNFTHRKFNVGGANFSFAQFSNGNMPALKPPRLAAWLFLALAWVFLGSRVPFTVFLGIPCNLAALIFGAASLARGAAFTGLAVLGLGTVGSLIVYLVGVFRFFALVL